MGRILVETSRAPLLLVRAEGSVDDVAFADYLAQLRTFIDRGERYAVIIEASTAAPPPASQRRLQADQMREDRVRMKAQCVGGAFVIAAPLVRGAMTAILWLQPLPFAHVIVASEAAAEAWALARLRAAGLAASPVA